MPANGQVTINDGAELFVPFVSAARRRISIRSRNQSRETFVRALVVYAIAIAVAFLLCFFFLFFYYFLFFMLFDDPCFTFFSPSLLFRLVRGSCI